MNDQPDTQSAEQAFRIAYLVAGYIRKTLTSREHDELDAWVEASDENMKMFEELTDEKNIEANLAWMDKVNTETQLAKVKSSMTFHQPVQRMHPRMQLISIIAAAIVMVAVAVFVIQRMTDGADKQSARTEILPTNDKTILRLSDGSIIDLPATSNGIFDATSGVNKTGAGQIVYEKKKGEQTLFHTLTTSTGGQYQVQLSDGSKVWLNATSSLVYPTQFTGGERVVELLGEGYFEIAKNAGKPFIVKLNNASVKVLGTHFNISGYANEPLAVTLLEGSVEVASGEKKLRLQPGEQAEINANAMRLIKDADEESVTGWKEGQFVFKDANIKNIMQQVMRWYDVQVVYEAQVNHLFNGHISRREPLSKVLRLLELTGKIHFKVENKIVYVLR